MAGDTQAERTALKRWLQIEPASIPALSRLAEIAAYVAAVRATIGGVASPDVVAALAGAAWDAWGSGSKYITREQFIALVQDALNLEPAASRAIRAIKVDG